jgi:hypothetical protein
MSWLSYAHSRRPSNYPDRGSLIRMRNLFGLVSEGFGSLARVPTVPRLRLTDNPFERMVAGERHLRGDGRVCASIFLQSRDIKVVPLPRQDQAFKDIANFRPGFEM